MHTVVPLDKKEEDREITSYKRHVLILNNVLNGQLPLDKRELSQLLVLTKNNMSRVMGKVALTRVATKLKLWAQRDRQIEALIAEVRAKYPQLDND